MSRQELLREAWVGGMVGCMSGQTQAKAWALREAWRDEHGDTTYGMLTHIASKLYVISPPKAKKEHPTTSALTQFFQKIDSDKEGWFPGKNDQKKRDPDFRKDFVQIWGFFRNLTSTDFEFAFRALRAIAIFVLFCVFARPQKNKNSRSLPHTLEAQAN